MGSRFFWQSEKYKSGTKVSQLIACPAQYGFVERDGAISGGLDYRQACKAHLPGIRSDAVCTLLHLHPCNYT
jgi:hypothetical protein